MHRLLLVATAEDAPRAQALCAAVSGSKTRLVAPTHVATELVGPWDVIVVAAAPQDAVVAAALDAAHDSPIPVIVLAEALDADVAALVARAAGRVCLYAHGAALLAETIARVGSLLERRTRRMASERIHRAAMRCVADVVFLLGVEHDDFRFLEVNPGFTRATGLAEEAVVGKLVSDVIPEPSLSLVLDRYRAAITARDVVRWSEVTPYPTGTKHGDVSITPIFDGDRCTHLVGTVHDVTELREAEAQLRALSARVEAAREEERTGIAREIHDQLGQSLTALSIDLAWIASRAKSAGGLTTEALLERVSAARELCHETIEQVRRISAELRPAVLDDLGLNAALAWEGGEFEKRTGIECAVRTDADDADLARDVTTVVFRVFQEVLTNIVRHAGAKRVDVALDRRGTELNLTVRDDGRGIRPEEIERPTSLGILGIRERARRIGGRAEFTPADPGTTVTLRVPLAAAT